jgi:hypothetical protein
MLQVPCNSESKSIVCYSDLSEETSKQNFLLFGQKKENTQNLLTFKHFNKTHVSKIFFEKLK